MAHRDYQKLFRDAEASSEYWAEVAIGDFTEEICRLLDEKPTTRAELARRLGTTPAYVTKVLRGNANFTLASMAKIALALGSQVRVHLAPKGSYTIWKDLLGEPEETWTSQFKSHLTVSGRPQGQPKWDDLNKMLDQINEMPPLLAEKKAPGGPEKSGTALGGSHDSGTAAA